ncbi:RNA polymerase sigma-70 factor [Niabella sp. CC-SYL272]|uniref:RNA polymerase sigma-70 factor n=1 Tax=Niabella agricola TaxID=2891571 RepID=UPI001F27AEBB|nr:RNA polymerase sigma-70 factor [Niabella agricola]MCF3109646.1 RNA polymerase sigma-70 factor [Niabella agricola]
MQATSIDFLFRQIGEGQKNAFDQLFHRYYERMVRFALQYVKQPEPAEELVSSVFINVWQRRERLPEVRTPEVYLFVSVRNACLNYLRQSAKLRTIHHAPVPDGAQSEDIGHTEYRELEAIVHAAIERLPVQRKMIFRLIREEGLKAKEVAEILSVSVRTVENQLYKAVKSLADTISEYLGYHPKEQRVTGRTLLLFF